MSTFDTGWSVVTPWGRPGPAMISGTRSDSSYGSHLKSTRPWLPHMSPLSDVKMTRVFASFPEASSSLIRRSTASSTDSSEFM